MTLCNCFYQRHDPNAGVDCRMDEAGSRARIAAFTARKLSGAPPVDVNSGACQELQEVMEAKSISIQVGASSHTHKSL